MNKPFAIGIALLGLVAAGCQERQPARREPATKPPTAAAATVAAEPVRRAPVLDSLLLPNPSTAPGGVLPTGRFHDDEVPADALQLRWLGLFSGRKGYYLAPATIQTNRVQDVVLDEGDEKTGWEVTTAETTDSCRVLLTGLGPLPAGPVDSAAVPAGPLEPGKPLRFVFHGIRYALTARCQYDASDPAGNTIRNYRLYLSAADRPGVEQLLAAAPRFDDTIMMLVWAGDLDHDQRPDFILDTTTHYNVTSWSLFLSAKAPKAELVRLVGLHTSVGC